MGVYVTTPSREECRKAVDRAYLLDLDWGGRIYRLSTRPLVMTTDKAADVQYVGGIINDPAPVQDTNRTGVSDTAPSVPLALAIDGTDIAAKLAGGARLQEARGTLWEVFIDHRGQVVQSWRRRIAHVIDGRFTRPTLDDPEEPVSYLKTTLEEQPYDTQAPFLDPAATITPDTWGEVSESSDSAGKPYPVPVGYPGVFRLDDGTEGSTSGSPAYPVEFDSGTGDVDTVLIADGEVVAETVIIQDGVGNSARFNVKPRTDGKGRIVAVADISGSGSLDRTRSIYYCKFDLGGIPNPFGPGPLRGYGDVLLWIAARATDGINLGAWIAEAEHLNRVPVDTFLNGTDVSWWEMFIAFVGEMPGLGVRRDANGLRPVVHRLDLDTSECPTIQVGPDFSALTQWQYRRPDSDKVNAVTVSFAKRIKTDRYRRTLTVTPRPSDSDETQAATSYAVMSESRLGRVQSVSKEARYLYDESGAALVATETVRLLGFDDRTRDYLVSYAAGGWVEVDGVVVLKDDVYPNGLQLQVVRKAPAVGGYVLTMALDDDPVRLAAS